MPRILRRILFGSQSCLLKTVIAIVVVLAAQQVLAVDADCERHAGQWWCRVCHQYHDNSAVICPRHPDNPLARLEAQKQRFRRELQSFFSASSVRVVGGHSVELTWYTHCVTRVQIEPDIGEVAEIGAVRVRPSKTTVYRLVTESPWTDWVDENKELSVEVLPATPDAELTVSAQRVFEGDSVNLKWKTHAASRVTLEPGAKQVAPNGETSSYPLRQDTTFRLVVEDEDALTTTREAKVSVIPAPHTPELPPPADQAALFRGAAPTIEFPARRPRPGVRTDYYLPPSETRKLEDFALFLHQHPEIDFVVSGHAYEHLPRNPVLNNNLAAGRRDIVATYLSKLGVKAERMKTDTPETHLSVSPYNARGRKEIDARSVFFTFGSVPPLLEARLYPQEIRQGESALLVWSTRNASRIWVNGDAYGQQGEIRLKPAQNTDYLVTARNEAGRVVSTKIYLLVLPEPPPKPLPTPDPGALVRENSVAVFFGPGTARLSSFALKTLDRDALRLLQPELRTLRIQLRARVGAGEQLALARARAEACQKYLIHYGVEPERLRVTVAPDDVTDEVGETAGAARALSRRVEILYDTGPEPGPGSPRPSQGGRRRQHPGATK